jgi:hypothetical protein
MISSAEQKSFIVMVTPSWMDAPWHKEMEALTKKYSTCQLVPVSRMKYYNYITGEDVISNFATSIWVMNFPIDNISALASGL